MPVNGEYYDWENLVILLPHGPLLDVDSIEYKAKIDREQIYGQGSAPRGYGEGNISYDGKLVMLREEYNRFLLWCTAASKSPLKVKFTISVAFFNDDQGLTIDQLKGCKIGELGKSMKQGDKKSLVECPFLYLGESDNGVDLEAGSNLL